MNSVSYAYKARVTKIKDGNTVECEIDLGFKVMKTQTLTLSRITPRNLNSSDKHERGLASMAKTYLMKKSLLADVIVHTNKNKKVGKYVAEIFLVSTQENLSDLLLAEGMATTHGGNSELVNMDS